MVRSTILLLAVITGWALSAPEADARHGRWLGRFGCAGRAADYGCSGADQGCQQPAASCAGEGGYGFRRAPLRRTAVAVVRAPVVVVRGAAAVVTAPVKRFGSCRNGQCRR